MKIIKKILMIVAFTLVFIPCLLVLNESDTIYPNFIGFFYIGILFIVFKTKVAKKLLYEAYLTCQQIDRWIYGRGN